jgi:hypothetical protein
MTENHPTEFLNFSPFADPVVRACFNSVETAGLAVRSLGNSVTEQDGIATAVSAGFANAISSLQLTRTHVTNFRNGGASLKAGAMMIEMTDEGVTVTGDNTVRISAVEKISIESETGVTIEGRTVKLVGGDGKLALSLDDICRLDFGPDKSKQTELEVKDPG